MGVDEKEIRTGWVVPEEHSNEEDAVPVVDRDIDRLTYSYLVTAVVKVLTTAVVVGSDA